MRLNWFAEPVVFFSSLLFLVAAQIFTMRPKLDDTTASELANLGVTTVTAHPGRRVQGRWLRTTNTRPGGAGDTSSREKPAWMEVAHRCEHDSQIKIWKSP